MPWGSRGGTLPDPGGGRYPGGGVPWPGGVPWRGGSTLARGGTLAGGAPWPGGGTQLGQHREYLLHGGRYASCVHAGGLSCLIHIFRSKINQNLVIYGLLNSSAHPHVFFLSHLTRKFSFVCFRDKTGKTSH